MELPKEYISYSQIRLYKSCPRKYYYYYVEKRTSPVKDKVFLGVVFHAVVEHYFEKKIAGKDITTDRLLEVFAERFESLRGQQEIDWETPQSPNETHKRGIAFVKYFMREVAPTIDPLMVEKELWAELPGMDVKLRGVIDLVETDFSITDFKTTTAKWSKSRIRGSYLQMVIYRYLFEKAFGDVISQLKFKIIYSKKATNIKHQEVVVKAGDVDCDYTQMIDIIKFVVESIQKEVFYKNENYSCGFCEFKDFCKSDTRESVGYRDAMNQGGQTQ